MAYTVSVKARASRTIKKRNAKQQDRIRDFAKSLGDDPRPQGKWSSPRSVEC